MEAPELICPWVLQRDPLRDQVAAILESNTFQANGQRTRASA